MSWVLWLVFSGTLFAQKEIDFAAKSGEVIYLLKQERYAGVMLRMDKDMKRILNEDKLMGLWDGLQMQFGQVKEIGPSKVIKKDTGATTLTPITFENKKLGLKLVFNSKAEICGIWIDAPTQQYKPAAYINATKFYEYKKMLADPLFPTEAIVTIPAKGNKFPVVIITGGSGPTDKDLTMGPNKIYKDLAWGLAQNGIAVVRYDKRTKTHGADMYKLNKNITVKEEYLDDLKLAIALVKKYPDLDSNRIVVLGHSEGGYLIPYFESQIKGISAYVAFAAPYRNMATLITEQLIYLKANDDVKNAASYDLLIAKAMLARDHLNPSIPNDSLPEGLSANYLLNLNANAPEKHIQKIMDKSILFVQGNRDYQVKPEEMELWRKALKGNPHARFEIFPKLNHLGIEGEGISLPVEYENPGNLPSYFIDKITQFVLYQ